jgi:hypothetical protein
VTIKRGEQAVALEPELDVELEGEKTAALSLSWRAEGSSLTGEAKGEKLTAEVKLSADAGGAVAVSVTLHYLVAARVEREALRLRLPGSPQAIGRDLAWAALTGELRVDRGTPIAFAAMPAKGAGAAVVGGPGFVAATATPREGDTEVELILDDAASHPFARYKVCRDKWVRGEEPARSTDARTRRAAGDTVLGRATLLVVAPGETFTPVVVERWGAGARAAIVLTDHADNTDTAALRAVLYGTSDKKDPDYGTKGILGRHLSLTRTFFVHKGKGTLADDPEARDLADELVAAGSEVGSHSITPGKDKRATVEKGLPALAAWSPTTWIDHQPDTNCEAVSNEGWQDSGAWGIRDLLYKAGFRWIWAANDLAGADNQVANLFIPDRPAEAAPPIFPLPVDPRLWLFRSVWFYAPAKELAAALSDKALDELENGRGLFVAHTYLSPTERTTSARLAKRTLVKIKKKVAVLDAGFDAALARIQTRVAAGSLASLTWRSAGERLRALGDVTVRYRGDGSAVVENTGTNDVKGLTVALPASGELAVEGAKVLGSRADTGRATVWFDLDAGTQAIVRVKKGQLWKGGAVTLGAGK